MSKDSPIVDIAFGEIHERIISGLSKEDMIKEYAIWAPLYDKDCKESCSSHKRIAAKALIENVCFIEKELYVLDAACGTGIPAEHLKIFAEERGIKLKMFGVDFSPDMLKVASRKHLYSELIQADLNQNLPFEKQQFDLFMAVGLFLDGHCGPNVLQNIVKHVKSGGLGVITVRHKTYEAKENEYLQAFKDSNVIVISNFVDHYFEGVEGNYIILKKNNSA